MITDILTVRLPPDVKAYYCDRRGLSRKILEDYFYVWKKNQLTELLQEKEKLQQRVIQIDEIVIQKTFECNTKQANCNTPTSQIPVPDIDTNAIAKERQRRRKEERKQKRKRVK